MRILLPLLAAGLLGGCTTAGTLYNTNIDEAYRPGDANAAVVDGALPTVVIGTPVTGSEAAAALAPIRPGGALAADRLAVAKADAITRLVLVFDHQGNGVTANSICTPTPTPAVLLNRPEVLAITGAYCTGTRLNSIATAVMPAPASLADPAYADTVEQLISTIFPLSPQAPIVLPFTD